MEGWGGGKGSSTVSVVYSDIGYSDRVSGLLLTVTLFQIPDGVTVTFADCIVCIKETRILNLETRARATICSQVSRGINTRLARVYKSSLVTRCCSWGREKVVHYAD